ncbi:MAG TPA: proteasome accessory factor PafA2 family protein [Candidatus Limnocylindrales bacterium]|nr:proteasome accessory factor PafA2 family protein [Candidatus Limnocylindrales bacterium]
MNNSEFDPRLPLAYGNEEEIGFNVSYGSGDFEKIDPVQMQASIPERFNITQTFLDNGYRAYPDQQYQEICIPECRTVESAARHIRGSELLATEIAQNYAVTSSIDDPEELVDVRFQRRTIDAEGRRNGVHDNIGCTAVTMLALKQKPLARDILNGHHGYRSFVTGAGFIGPDGPEFSQKVGGLKHVENYGYSGSLYRFVNEASGEGRFESRSNDANISDWATRIRKGSMALGIVLAQTYLRDELVGIHTTEVLDVAKDANAVHLLPDGSIKPNEALLKAIDFEQQLADIALTELGDEVELPEELVNIAEELYVYCLDMRRVINNEASISILSNRADWAAKLTGISMSIEHEREEGSNRSLQDARSRSHDFAYDCVRVRAHGGRLIHTKVGWGYALRNRGIFKQPISTEEAAHALETPDDETRAYLRASLISQYDIENPNWDSLKYVSKSTGRLEQLSFHGVLQTRLDETQLAQLSDMPFRPGQ